MADWSMFGGGGGVSDAIKDQGVMARTAYEQAQTQRTQALLPGELTEQQQKILSNRNILAQQPQALEAERLSKMATAQFHQAETALKQSTLKEMQFVAQTAPELMSQIGQGADGKPLPASEVLDKLGQYYQTHGAPTTGLQYREKAATMREKESLVVDHALQAKKLQFQSEVDANDLLSRNIGLVKQSPDRAEAWQRIVTDFNQSHPGEPFPFPKNIVPTDGQIDAFQESLMKYGDQQKAQHARDMADAAQKRLDMQEKKNEEIAAAKKRAQDMQAERDALKAKNGELTKEANKAELADGYTLLQSIRPEITAEWQTAPPQVKAYVTSAVNQATMMRKRNPAITMEGALMDVFNKTQKNLVYDEGTKILGVSIGSGSFKYNPQGAGVSGTISKGTQDSPYQLPSKPEDMVKGSWYPFPTKDGVKVGRYDGGKNVYFPE